MENGIIEKIKLQNGKNDGIYDVTKLDIFNNINISKAYDVKDIPVDNYNKILCVIHENGLIIYWNFYRHTPINTIKSIKSGINKSSISNNK